MRRSGFGCLICGSLAVLVSAAAAVADPAIKVPLAEPEVNVSPLGASDECVLSEECIDQYLWSVYERARKVDTIKVQEQVETTVKKKGKSRTIKKTGTKFVVEDFTWKDPHAAEKAGMSVAQYVIGGMDGAFKARLYHLFRALDDAGLAPGMTSGFRDDYRQSIRAARRPRPMAPIMAEACAAAMAMGLQSIS